MKSHFILTVFGTLWCLSFLPIPAFAYDTTAQHAFALDSKTGMYTIEFRLGHENHDIYVPVHAYSDMPLSDNALAYDILNSDGESVNGTRTGIVLANLPIENGMYHIPKGRMHRLTLLVLYTPVETMSSDTYRLQATHLPFTFDNTQKLKLNPSELQYYTTKPLTLE